MAFADMRTKEKLLLSSALGVVVLLFFRFSSPSLSPTSSANQAFLRQKGIDTNFGIYKRKGSDYYHVSCIFDINRYKYAVQMLRSLRATVPLDKPILAHLITTPDVEAVVLAERVPGITYQFYPYESCQRLAGPVLPHASSDIHLSAHCKLFLAAMVDEEAILFVDNDITFVQDPFTSCYPLDSLEKDQYIAMAPDFGDICQIDPDKCWPMGLTHVVPKNLECGNLPRYAKSRKPATKHCASPGDVEPAQVNGGIVWMHLDRMRDRKFIDNYIDTTLHTARMIGTETNHHALWGEQEFINNFFRRFPETLKVLPCGCNYQFAGIRRFVYCPSQPIYAAHGWKYGTNKPTSDPFSKLFFYYYNDCGDCSDPPQTPKVSYIDDMGPKTPVKFGYTKECPLQRYECNENFGSKIATGQLVTIVLVARSSGPIFGEMVHSLLRQSHKNIHLIVVVTSSVTSKHVKSVINLVQRNSVYSMKVTVLESKLQPATSIDEEFANVCKQCKGTAATRCRKPWDTISQSLQEFHSCRCGTQSVIPEYIHEALGLVDKGWVTILEDEYVSLADDRSLGEVFAHVRGNEELIVWKSQIATDIQPASINTNDLGLLDAFNFMFHSSQLKRVMNALKKKSSSCIGATIAQSIGSKVRRVDRIVTQSTALSPPSFGATSEKITVIIMAYETEGFRVKWLLNTLRAYTSPEYSFLVDQVLLVWNNMDVPPPAAIPKAVKVVKGPKNSLNNRWIETLPHIRTKAILNLDNDLYITKEGVICLFNHWLRHQDRLIGPFVRTMRNGKYVIDELLHGEEYLMVIPRAIMLSKSSLEIYKSLPHHLHEYVDDQEGHCDDLVLNAGVANEIKKAPLRVRLPKGSIVDYYGACWKSKRQETAGLGLQKDRGKLRAECLTHIISQFPSFPFVTSKSIGTCSNSGYSTGSLLGNTDGSTNLEKSLRAMTKEQSCDLATI